jgi:hypothetical protein
LNPTDDGKKTRVFVCPQCNKALRDWLAQHPNDKWGKALERTADRRVNSFLMTSTLKPKAKLALVSGGSACSR